MLLKKFRSSSSCCLSCSHINYWYLHKDHSVKGGSGTSHSTQTDVHSEQLKLIPALHYTKSMLGKVCVREIVWTSAKKQGYSEFMDCECSFPSHCLQKDTTTFSLRWIPLCCICLSISILCCHCSSTNQVRETSLEEPWALAVQNLEMLE